MNGPEHRWRKRLDDRAARRRERISKRIAWANRVPLSEEQIDAIVHGCGVIPAGPGDLLAK